MFGISRNDGSPILFERSKSLWSGVRRPAVVTSATRERASGFPKRARGVGAIAENRPDQSGQPGARSHFQKCFHPGVIHRLDLGHEFDRSGELGRQQVPGSDIVIRIREGCGIGKNGNPAGAEWIWEARMRSNLTRGLS